MGNPELTFRIATTREDLEGALRLVYHNYVEKNYCGLNRFQMHFYLYDVLPGTRTLVALDGGRVVATLTLVFDSDMGLPSETLYGAELNNLRAAGRKIAEISKLATDRGLGSGQIVAVRGLFRLAWLLASAVRGATDFCIMVEPHHDKFYRKAYLFERLGEQREDPKAGDAPSVLLRLDLQSAPERFRESYGEATRPRNLYWYNCVSPELDELRSEASEVDAQLTELNRRSTAARRADGGPPPSRSMRRYTDFRMFAMAFNVEKIGEEAEEQHRKGLFDREIDQYSRLLSVMPPSYAPERQADICVNMAGAAWHCGLYEKVLELCSQARELTVSPDTRAASHRYGCLGLHFLGRRQEALDEATRGLAVPGSSPLARARLHRTRARLHMEAFALDSAGSDLSTARKLVAPLPSNAKTNRVRAMIQHNLWLLESRLGNYVAAGQALREGAPHLTHLNRTGTFHYYEGLAAVERAAGRPLEELAHIKQAQRLISPQANQFNAAVFANKRAICLLSLGELDAARASLEESTALAEKSRYTGVIADAVAARATLMAGEDRVSAAQELLEKWLVAHGEELTERPRAGIMNVRGYLAVEAGAHGAAASLLAEVEQHVTGMDEYRIQTRLLQVMAELQAGQAARARELSEELADPSRLPGHEVYRACWNLARGLLNLLEDGPPGDSEKLIRAAFDLNRDGEAWGALAHAAVQVLRAMAALRLLERAPSVWDLAVSAAREATTRRRLPLRARNLSELTGS